MHDEEATTVRRSRSPRPISAQSPPRKADQHPTTASTDSAGQSSGAVLESIGVIRAPSASSWPARSPVEPSTSRTSRPPMGPSASSARGILPSTSSTRSSSPASAPSSTIGRSATWPEYRSASRSVHHQFAGRRQASLQTPTEPAGGELGAPVGSRRRRPAGPGAIGSSEPSRPGPRRSERAPSRPRPRWRPPPASSPRASAPRRSPCPPLPRSGAPRRSAGSAARSRSARKRRRAGRGPTRLGREPARQSGSRPPSSPISSP